MICDRVSDVGAGGRTGAYGRARDPCGCITRLLACCTWQFPRESEASESESESESEGEDEYARGSEQS